GLAVVIMLTLCLPRYVFLIRLPPSSPLFPYTTLFRSALRVVRRGGQREGLAQPQHRILEPAMRRLPGLVRGLALRLLVLPRENPDRKSTRLNSSHVKISYAVFCLKKKRIFTLESAAAK